jgi:hypothetical protein
MSRQFRPDGGEYSSSWDYNIQYNPEKCGLELIADLETAGGYEFCTTLVLLDKATGEILIAQDSGCSCPTPFEDFTSTGDLIPYQDEAQLRRLIEEYHTGSQAPDAGEVSTVLRKVREAQRARLYAGTRIYAAGEQPPIVADQHEELIAEMEAAGTAFLLRQPEYVESVRQFDEYLTDVGENDWQREDELNLVERAINGALKKLGKEHAE